MKINTAKLNEGLKILKVHHRGDNRYIVRDNLSYYMKFKLINRKCIMFDTENLRPVEDEKIIEELATIFKRLIPYELDKYLVATDIHGDEIIIGSKVYVYYSKGNIGTGVVKSIEQALGGHLEDTGCNFSITLYHADGLQGTYCEGNIENIKEKQK